MSLSNENNPMMCNIAIGDVAAGVGVTIPVYSPTGTDRIKSAKLINNADLAGNDSANFVLALRKKGGNDMATYTNDVASGGVVQREGKLMTLAASDADKKMGSGDNLELDISHTGAGGALTGAILQLEIVL